MLKINVSLIKKKWCTFIQQSTVSVINWFLYMFVKLMLGTEQCFIL